jgi:bifunctional DNA primase/polymerase-like protein
MIGKETGPGVDVRGIGGYVVAAGSARPEGRYRRAGSSSVEDAPAWLPELVTAKPPRDVAADRSLWTSHSQAAAAHSDRIPEGQRNGRLPGSGL